MQRVTEGALSLLTSREDRVRMHCFRLAMGGSPHSSLTDTMAFWGKEKKYLSTCCRLPFGAPPPASTSISACLLLPADMGQCYPAGAHRSSRPAPFSAPQAYCQLQLSPRPRYPSCQLCSYFALQIQPQQGQALVPSILNHQPKMLFLFPTAQTPIAFDAVIASFSCHYHPPARTSSTDLVFPMGKASRKKPLCFQPCITTS